MHCLPADRPAKEQQQKLGFQHPLKDLSIDPSALTAASLVLSATAVIFIVMNVVHFVDCQILSLTMSRHGPLRVMPAQRLLRRLQA
jgi:hypothetical protein